MGDERTEWKDTASRLQIESDRYQQENLRLRKVAMKREAELAKARQNSQDALEQNSTAATSKIEGLKAEIAQWKDKAAAQRGLEDQCTRLEASCKRLEMKLLAEKERNHTLSQRLTQMMAEATNGATKEKPQGQPKFRGFLDSMATKHTNELSNLRDTHEKLLKQHRLLESSFRDLQISMEAERRDMYAKQRKLAPIMTDMAYGGLLDDNISITDTHTSRVITDPNAPDSHHGSDYAPSTVTGGSSSPTRYVDPENFGLMFNSMVYSPTGQYRYQEGSQISSPTPTPIQPDTRDPFSTVLPRRHTSTTSGGSSTKATKIKPNSEIRIYGRYIFL